MRNDEAGENENNDGPYAGYEPCGEDFTSQYLNLPEVKTAIHVNEKIRWDLCSDILEYDYDDSEVSTAPIYTELANSGLDLRMLVFSGDNDSVCPTIGTQDWIWDLGFGQANPEWGEYIVSEQPSGYVSTWAEAKFAFVTVHGAGHEVPAYMPEVALDMWEKFLNGFWTCDNSTSSLTACNLQYLNTLNSSEPDL